MRDLPPILVALACALGASCATGPAAAARHTPPVGVPAPRGPGRIIPVLADGTLREPSVDRAETVDEPDTLAAHHVAWDVTLAGVATDRIGTLDKQGQEAGAASLTYGLGHGTDVGVRAGAWERSRIDLPDGSGTEEASGLGATTVLLGRTVRPARWHGAGVRACAFTRFAGASDGPGPREAETGAVLAVDEPLGEATRIALGATPAWVGNALDAGHHFELAAGLVVSRELGDHAALWLETVSVSSHEPGRPWLGVVDAGVRLDVAGRIGLTLGATAGRGGGHDDVGALARFGIHS